jgi:hypothetical protein
VNASLADLWHLIFEEMALFAVHLAQHFDVNIGMAEATFSLATTLKQDGGGAKADQTGGGESGTGANSFIVGAHSN